MSYKKKKKKIQIILGIFSGKPRYNNIYLVVSLEADTIPCFAFVLFSFITFCNVYSLESDGKCII